MTAPFPVHLTRTPGGYTASSPELPRGIALSAGTRELLLAGIEQTFRLWAGERMIEINDLTGEQP